MEQVLSNLANAKLYSEGPLAEDAGRTIIIYGKHASNDPLRAWARDNTGNSTDFPLPGLLGWETGNTIFAVLKANDLWVYCNFGPTLLRHYALSGSPLPTSAVLVETKQLGEPMKDWGNGLREYSMPGALHLLASGGLVVSWYHWFGGPRPLEDTWIDYGIAYRSPAGEWQVHYPIRVTPLPGSGGGITMSRQAIAQHPVDGSVWIFSHRDSFYSIAAMHLTEIADGLRLDWLNQDYICSFAHLDDLDGPDGEFPYLAAIGDSDRQAILLAYQSHAYKIFYAPDSPSPAARGTEMRIASIKADGTRTFLPFKMQDVWLERLSPFAFFAKPDALHLAFWRINQALLTNNEVWFASYANGEWQSPAWLYTDPNLALRYGFASIFRFPFGNEAIQLALQETSADYLTWTVKHFSITPDPVPLPPPPPPEPPPPEPPPPEPPPPNQVAGVSIHPVSGVYQAKQGTTLNIPITVQNEGNGPDSFAASAISRRGWTLTYLKSIGILAPEEIGSFTLGVKIPRGTAGQTDTVTLTARSLFDSGCVAEVNYQVTAIKRGTK